MSGFEQNKTSPTFGPRRASRLELMGIRFANDPSDGTGAGTGYKAPESQEELDRIIGDRLNREREKFKDYDTFKSKAEQLDALNKKPPVPSGDGQNDAINQRLQDFESRVTTAEQTAKATQEELGTTQVQLLRSQVALDHGIGKDDLILLTGDTREDLDKQAERIKKLNAGSGKIPGQGQGGDGGNSGGVAAGRTLFESKRKKTTTT